MSTNLIFCFDGTSNDAGDSIEERGLLSIKDSSITNVLKLHLLLGGDLKSGHAVAGQKSFYFSGVGTTGSKARKAFDMTFAVSRVALNPILREAGTLLEQNYQDGDHIFLFGFSRGAAIARRFASSLKTFAPGIPDSTRIRFVGVFDTVASIGKPNLDKDEDPSSAIVFEGGTISARIDEALHLLAIDETRLVFRPTLMNRESKVTEVWMPGVHSDVGGGYREDGLSDGAMTFLLEEFERRKLGLKVLSSAKIAYEKLFDAGIDPSISVKDVALDPDCFSKLHRHTRLKSLAKITLQDRVVCVNIADKKSEHRPLIHWSVAERIRGDAEYRPEALRGLALELLLPDGSRQALNGLEELTASGRTLHQLQVGESRELACNALRRLNHSGIELVSGGQYVFSVPDGQRWLDSDIPCGPSGWTRADIEKGFVAEAFIAAAEFARRAPGSNWFALMGAVGTNDLELLEILQHTANPYVAKSTDEFCSFANDLEKYYSNNSGRVTFSIKRVG